MLRHWRLGQLLEELISNKLFGQELDEFFLASLAEDDRLQAYSDLLEAYLQELICQPTHSPSEINIETRPVSDSE